MKNVKRGEGGGKTDAPRFCVSKWEKFLSISTGRMEGKVHLLPARRKLPSGASLKGGKEGKRSTPLLT